MPEEIKQKAREEITKIVIDADMSHMESRRIGNILVELFDSLLSQALAERDKKFIKLLKKYSPTCGGGKCYVVEELLSTLTTK